MIIRVRKTVLAPELVSLWAILGVAVSYDTATMATVDDEHLPHLVTGQFLLVVLDFVVACI